MPSEVPYATRRSGAGGVVEAGVKLAVGVSEGRIMGVIVSVTVRETDGVGLGEDGAVESTSNGIAEGEYPEKEQPNREKTRQGTNKKKGKRFIQASSIRDPYKGLNDYYFPESLPNGCHSQAAIPLVKKPPPGRA